MMKKERRKFSAAFKAKVALEAIKERDTIQQLASKYEVHANQISLWKKEFLAGAEAIFSGELPAKKEAEDKEKDQLYGKIGQLQIEVDFLKKVLGK
jgi:transposase-like protein